MVTLHATNIKLLSRTCPCSSKSTVNRICQSQIGHRIESSGKPQSFFWWQAFSSHDYFLTYCDIFWILEINMMLQVIIIHENSCNDNHGYCKKFCSTSRVRIWDNVDPRLVQQACIVWVGFIGRIHCWRSTGGRVGKQVNSTSTSGRAVSQFFLDYILCRQQGHVFLAAKHFCRPLVIVIWRPTRISTGEPHGGVQLRGFF